MVVVNFSGVEPSFAQCLGQNYAYNEASLFMIRLLQRFEGFTLADDKQLPPPWKTGPQPADPPNRSMFGIGWPGTRRKTVEKVFPGNNIVLHVKVICIVMSSATSLYLFYPRGGYGFESRRLSEAGSTNYLI